MCSAVAVADAVRVSQVVLFLLLCIPFVLKRGIIIVAITMETITIKY